MPIVVKHDLAPSQYGGLATRAGKAKYRQWFDSLQQQQNLQLLGLAEAASARDQAAQARAAELLAAREADDAAAKAAVGKEMRGYKFEKAKTIYTEGEAAKRATATQKAIADRADAAAIAAEQRANQRYDFLAEQQRQKQAADEAEKSFAIGMSGARDKAKNIAARDQTLAGRIFTTTRKLEDLRNNQSLRPDERQRQMDALQHQLDVDDAAATAILQTPTPEQAAAHEEKQAVLEQRKAEKEEAAADKRAKMILDEANAISTVNDNLPEADVMKLAAERVAAAEAYATGKAPAAPVTPPPAAPAPAQVPLEWQPAMPVAAGQRPLTIEQFLAAVPTATPADYPAYQQMAIQRAANLAAQAMRQLR